MSSLLKFPSPDEPDGDLFSRIVAALGATKPEMFKCHAHDDQKKSLSVFEGDGRLMVRCHAGCTAQEIAQALGVWKTTRSKRTIVATYDYTDELGTLLFQSVRYDPKDFRQRRFEPGHPDADREGHVWKLDGVRRVLYRLPDILKAAKAGRTVYVVEGEKDVHALESLGLPATCNAGGAAAKWREEYSAALKGAKVVIIPDNDEPGRKHARAVEASLKAHGIPVTVLHLDGLPEHGDVSNWMDQKDSWSPEQFRSELEQLASAASEPKAPALSGVRRMSEVEMRPIEWLWPGRIPKGKIVYLEGPAGVGKSTLTLDLAARVTTGRAMPGEAVGTMPATVLVLGLEDDIGDTMRPRLEAAGGDSSRVLVLAEPERYVGNLSAVCDLLRASGASLLILDPLNTFIPQTKNRNDDVEVRAQMAPLQVVLQETGASIIAIRHYGKAEGRSALDKSLGATGYSAVARSVLAAGKDPDDPMCSILAVTKTNLAGSVPSLRFTTQSVRIGGIEGVPKLEWLGESEYSADDLIAAKEHQQSAVAKAMAWLPDVLSGGPIEAQALRKMAEAAGLGWRTIERARQRLGGKIDNGKVGSFGTGPSMWRLGGAAA